MAVSLSVFLRIEDAIPFGSEVVCPTVGREYSVRDTMKREGYVPTSGLRPLAALPGLSHSFLRSIESSYQGGTVLNP